MKKTFANPDGAEREYTRAMIRYVRALEREWNTLARDRLPGIQAGYAIEARSDGWTDTLDALIAEFLRLALASGQVVIDRLPTQFAMVSSFNEVQFRAVFKANTGLDLPDVVPGAPRSLLGVNIFRDEPFLVPLAEGWIKENTALIKDVPTKVAGDLEGIIRRGTMAGKSVRDLSKEIKARWPMTENRARLIAQDQVLKLNADLTRNRLQSVGVSEYIWRSVQDSRVRPEHVQHNGNTYSWAKPPSDGNPGQPVRCRCRAEAVWPDDAAAQPTAKPTAQPDVVEPIASGSEQAFNKISAYKRKSDTQSAIDDFDAKSKDFNEANDAYQNFKGRRPDELVFRAINAQDAKIEAQKLKTAALVKEANEVLEFAYIPQSSRALPTDIVIGEVPKSIKGKANKAAALVSKLVHKDIAPTVKMAAKGGRAFYSPTTRTATLSTKSELSVFCHEIIHDIEHNHPKIAEKTTEFLLKRSGGEGLKFMKDLDPDRTYGPKEMAYEDSWVKRGGSPYMGKVYTGKPSTEILTMGVERLLLDPVGFARDDPEYLKFLLSVFNNED